MGAGKYSGAAERSIFPERPRGGYPPVRRSSLKEKTMSIRNVVLFTDDTTGETGDDVSTRRFSLDGQEWEIELSEANWEKLCKIVKPFTDAARKPKGNTPPRRHRA